MEEEIGALVFPLRVEVGRAAWDLGEAGRSWKGYVRWPMGSTKGVRQGAWLPQVKTEAVWKQKPFGNRSCLEKSDGAYN